MRKIKAYGKRVIVQDLTPDKEFKTASGIYISEGERKGNDLDVLKRGRVISSNIEEVKEKDIVVFDRLTGTELGFDDLIVLDRKDCLGVE